MGNWQFPKKVSRSYLTVIFGMVEGCLRTSTLTLMALERLAKVTSQSITVRSVDQPNLESSASDQPLAG